MPDEKQARQQSDNSATAVHLLLFSLIALFIFSGLGCASKAIMPDDFSEYVYPKTDYSKAQKAPDRENKELIKSRITQKIKNSAIPLNLEDCIKIALKNNEAIILAGKGVQIAKVQLWTANRAWLPRFTISGEASYRNNDAVSEMTIPAMGTMRSKIADRQSAQGIAELSMPIYLFGRIINAVQLAYAKVDSARADSRKTKQQIVFAVTQAYSAILELQQGIKVLESSVKLIEELLANARNFYEQGLITKNEVLALEVTLASRKQNLKEIRTALRQAKYQFNSLLDLEITRDTKLTSVADLPKFKFPETALVNLALRYRPEIFKAKAETQAAEEQLDLANSNRWPMLFGFVNVTASSASTLVNPAWLTVGLRFQWNVFDACETIGNIRAAKIAKQMRAVQNKMLYKKILVEVRTAYEELKLAEDKVAVTEKQIEQAEENLRILKDKFNAAGEKGALATSAEVLEGETMLLNAKREHWSAIYSVHRAWAKLELATGLKFDAQFVSQTQNLPQTLTTPPDKKIANMNFEPTELPKKTNSKSTDKSKPTEKKKTNKPKPFYFPDGE